MKQRSRTPLEELYERPGFLLRRAHQVNVAIFDDECGPFGITHTQYGLLMAIASSDDIDVAGAARLTSSDRTSTHVAINNMEQRGWIKRRTDPSDRRRRLLTVTPAGWKLMRNTEEALDNVKQRVASLLTPTDARALVRILKDLIAGSAARKASALALKAASSKPRRRPEASSATLRR